MRWLLLTVSVICLLVLAPAAALSQDEMVAFAGCGSATIDGTIGEEEWANADQVTLTGWYDWPWWLQAGDTSLQGSGFGDVSANNGFDGGTLYVQNDPYFLYLALEIEDPDDELDDTSSFWDLNMEFWFLDEPPWDPEGWVDCDWDAELCEDSDEGLFFAAEWDAPPDGRGSFGPRFYPAALEADWCLPSQPTAAHFAASPHGDVAHLEMRVDMTDSQFSNVPPGYCFNVSVHGKWAACGTDMTEAMCDWPDEAWGIGADWSYVADDDGGCRTICLNPCEVEFVPEPGTIMLLASGLMGMAGYAGLRLRKK